MKKKRQFSKIAFSTLEYAVFIAVAIAALVAMAWMISHKVQATHKDGADAFGEGRQFGSLAFGGRTPPFAYPALPGGTTGDGGGTVTDPDCDVAYLAQLAEDAQQKQQRAMELSQEEAAAKAAAADAALASETAKEAARIAREEATQAREAAEEARQAANDKQTECDDCNSSGGSGCEEICQQAQDLAEIATEKEQFADQKEQEAQLKEQDAALKEAEYQRLQQIADQKEQEARQAAQEAADAAEALQQANDACTGGGGPPPGCFLKGTKITLENGALKPIEEITTNDLVLSYNGKSTEPARVTKIFVHDKEKRYLIIVSDDNREIRVTANHPIFIGTAYKPAGELKRGDAIFILSTNKLETRTVRSIVRKKESVTVYNIEVAKNHNYFAEGILCHNKPPEEQLP